MNIRDSVTNYLKTALSTLTPYKVDEFYNSNMENEVVIKEIQYFRIYKIANHYEGYFIPKNGGNQNRQLLFRIFRLVDFDSAITTFDQLSTVIGSLYETKMPIIVTESGLQTIVSLWAVHSSWNMAHIAAYLGYSVVFESDVTVKFMNEKDNEGTYPIHLAVEVHSAKVVGSMLNMKGVDFCVLNEHGDSVLHICVKQNLVEMIKLFKDRVPPEFWNLLNAEGKSPLYLAIELEKMDLEEIKLLLDLGCDPSSGEYEEGYPIHLAVLKGATNLVNLLCTHSEEQLKLPVLKTGDTGLHLAGSHEMTGLLCDLGAPLDIRNHNNETALHRIIREGDLHMIVRVLLQWDFNTNIIDEDGNTLLHVAIKRGDVHIVRALIVFAADVNVVNKAGQSPRHVLCSNADGSSLYKPEVNKDLLLYTLTAVGANRCPKRLKYCTDGCSYRGDFEGTPPSPILDKNSTSYQAVTEFVERSNFCRIVATSSVRERRRHRHFAKKQQERKRQEQEGRCHEKTSVTEGLRLLCLDGGGIRGLILTQVLLRLEKVVGKPIVKCFDWIAGTSTGGFLALGLVHGKTLPDIRRMYILMKERVFKGTRPYATESLEAVIKSTFPEHIKMADVKQPRVVVTALLCDQFPPQLHLFRNYETPEKVLMQLAEDMDSSSSSPSSSNESSTSSEEEEEEETEKGDCDKETGHFTPSIEGTNKNNLCERKFSSERKRLNSKEPKEKHEKSFLKRFNLQNWRTATASKFYSIFKTGPDNNSLTVSNAKWKGKSDDPDEVKGESEVEEVTDNAGATKRENLLSPEEQPVWMAARATGAAPTFFRACGRFLDGGLAANNPTLDLLTEVQAHRFGQDMKGEEPDKIALLVSIGTGVMPITPIDEIDILRPNNPSEIIKSAMGISSLAKILVELATTSDGRAVERSRAWCISLGVPYFRFSPLLSAEVSLDCQDISVLLQMLWETEVYLTRYTGKLETLAHLLS